MPVRAIEYFEAHASYVKIITGDKSLLTNTALYELEEKLDPAQFFRIHKSIILNINFVKEINSLNSGDFKAVMKNGIEIRGSRNYKNRIREAFM